MFKKEDYAIALDFLPYGKSGEARGEPVVQVIGETQFTLLEVVPKQGIRIAERERVYIGRDERDKVDHIKGRIEYNELTSTAQREAEEVVRKLVTEKEKEFVAFINQAGPLNIRAHALEHLPTIGKKHLEALLQERGKKPFESFADIQTRVSHLGKVDEIFVQRVLNELKGLEKYYLFVKAPREERPSDFEDRPYRRDRRW